MYLSLSLSLITFPKNAQISPALSCLYFGCFDLGMLIIDWDLEAGYNYLLKEYEFIDAERTVALGASYGGYMVISHQRLVSYSISLPTLNFSPCLYVPSSAYIDWN